jgi:hypothetical protein
MRRIVWGVLCGWLLLVKPVFAQEAVSDSLAELNRRLNILAEEIERLKLGRAVVEAEESQYGLGPAASKVYRTDRGVSIAGYGEMVYTNFAKNRDNGTAAGRTDQLDLVRAIVYLGYKFSDRWLLNSELEFEHASTGSGGEVSVEFAQVEYLHRPEFNLRFGLLLLPMGLINELHEPTVFMGVDRPDVERVIIPSTWRENGAGIFGEAGMVSYRTYLVNGFKASGFSSSGLRGGRQKGAQAKANHFAWTGRVDVTPRPGILFGGSAYAGFSGQDLKAGAKDLRVGTVLYEGHVDIRYQGLWFSLLGTRATVGDVDSLNQVLGFTGNKSVGETLQGFYVQAGYDVLSRTPYTGQTLMPYIRYEAYNTQHAVPAGFSKDPSKEVRNLTVGVAFYPESRVVFKADFKNVDNEANTGINQVNAAVGYIF